MNTHTQASKALLDYSEAQHFLGGISRSTLKTIASRGCLRSITIGRRRLFPRTELERYVAERLNAENV